MHRVLIVDDESVIADTLGLIFNKHGFDTKVVYCADDALACAREFFPNLLVCDINMPGRSGWELLEDFSPEFPDCRVLILTGYHSNLARVDEQSQKHRHPVRLITKPCTPVELLREAGQMLASV
jgi:CheY-like chemotaxis protein